MALNRARIAGSRIWIKYPRDKPRGGSGITATIAWRCGPFNGPRPCGAAASRGVGGSRPDNPTADHSHTASQPAFCSRCFIFCQTSKTRMCARLEIRTGRLGRACSASEMQSCWLDLTTSYCTPRAPSRDFKSIRFEWSWSDNVRQPGKHSNRTKFVMVDGTW